MYDVLKVKPRGHDNSKLEFVFKNDVILLTFSAQIILEKIFQTFENGF